MKGISESSEPMSFGIIGGGITGLAMAYYLLKENHRVTVFEADSACGGLALSTQIQGVWIDKFYHCVLPSDMALLSLIDDLGLGDKVYWQETEMGFLYHRTLYPFTTPAEIMRFSPLSIIDRFRLGGLGVYSLCLKDWRRLEGITAEKWLTKACGKRGFRTIWKPLLSFKFGDQYHQVPATWLWGRFKRQATARKTHHRKEILGYVEGGNRVVVECLVDEIKKLGGVIRLSARVDSLKVQRGRVQGVVVNGKFCKFDRVVSTVPIPQFIKLVDINILNDELGDYKVQYQGVVCVVLALKSRLSPYYWIPVVNADSSFTGIIESTNLIRSEDLGGMHLVYLLNYVSAKDHLFSVSEHELTERWIQELNNLFQDFDSNNVMEARVFKTAFVEPVWRMNYSQLMPKSNFLKNTLHLYTTAQLYPEINNVSNCVQQAKIACANLSSGSANI